MSSPIRYSGGPTTLLNKWDGEVDELALEFERIQEATEYDPS